MKQKVCLVALWVYAAVSLYAQGVFVGINVTAPTRVGSLDGPLAGTNIVGQMLGGPGPSSLQPVGPIDYHNNGYSGVPTLIPVPGVPPYEYAYVQLLAWDSTFWGSNLGGVPSNQLGRTDLVTVLLTSGIFGEPPLVPQFTQPAIVPPIPEPSALALAIIGFGVLALRRRQKILIGPWQCSIWFGGLELEKLRDSKPRGAK